MQVVLAFCFGISWLNNTYYATPYKPHVGAEQSQAHAISGNMEGYRVMLLIAASLIDGGVHDEIHAPPMGAVQVPFWWC